MTKPRKISEEAPVGRWRVCASGPLGPWEAILDARSAEEAARMAEMCNIAPEFIDSVERIISYPVAAPTPAAVEGGTPRMDNAQQISAQRVLLEGRTLERELAEAEQTRDLYWKTMCEAVIAMGKVSPEAAPHIVGWARDLHARAETAERERDVALAERQAALLVVSDLKNNLREQEARLALADEQNKKLTDQLSQLTQPKRCG